MTENKQKTEKTPREPRSLSRRLFLDPSSPTVRSIFRVVLVVIFMVGAAYYLRDAVMALKSLIFMVILAIFLAYLFDPLVKLIRKPFKERNLDKFMPRSLAIVVAYVAVFLLLGFGISVLAPRIAEQARSFAQNIPSYQATAEAKFFEITQRYETLNVSPEVEKAVREKAAAAASELSTAIPAFIGSLAFVVISYVPWLLLIPILSFFFLKDVNLFRAGVLRMFPSGRWRARADSFLDDVNSTLSAYTRAQLISCVLIGTVCTIGFYFTGLNYSLLLGIIAGVLEFIPLIGPLFIAIIAITIGSFESASIGISTGVFLLVLRLVHDYVTYPRIVRTGIHLHPLAIILSVLAGEQLAGIPGVFLAIPIIAIFTVLYKHVLDHSGSTTILSGFLEKDSIAPETGENR